MKSQFLLGLFLFLILGKGFASEPVYPVWLIPDSLKENANVVIRFDDFSVDISNNYNAYISNRYAVTILNSRGDDHAEFLAPYDKLAKLSSFSIRIYDANGQLLEDVKSKEVQDYSAIPGFSLYQDTRVKYYKPSIRKYPFTMVISYQYTLNGYSQLPRWQPQSSPDMAIEKAVFTLSMPEENQVKWLEKNMPNERTERRDGKIITCTWEINRLAAFKPEFMQPYMKDVLPVVLVAPLDFNLEGYKGNMETWKSYGLWANQLLEGKNNLPEETQIKMRELIAGSADTIEMVRRIYQYMQQHTRYVSIQLGIGGFQPFDAETVDRVGYGDCKALTNYTKSLMEAVQIPAVYNLVRAGDEASRIITGFPSQQFNHVILSVPLANDTLWLECTNQDMPFAYLGTFTDNRRALAITDNGGVLVRTKSYEADSNLICTKATFHLDADGNCNADFDICYNGLQYDEVFGFIHADAENQRKWLIDEFYIPNSELTDYAVTNLPGLTPQAKLKVNFEINRYGVKSGKRMFVALNPVDAFPDIPAREEERRFDIELRESYIHTDSIVFKLPAGYRIEYLPPQVELSSDFGQFSAKVEQANGMVIYHRCLKVVEGRYDVSTYNEFYDFYSKIVKSDKAKLVLTSSDL